MAKEFDEMPLEPNLLRGIYSYGFEKPSEIQQKAIVPFVEGGDIIAQAQSGTGKTGAFAIGILQRLDFTLQACQALVLAPTRELALQTHEVISAIGDYLASGNPMFCSLFVGGSNKTDDRRKAQRTLVAVGCPGRVLDFCRQGILRFDSVKTAVLDEADEMLSQGFSEQVYNIFKFLPRDTQVALFSATMPPEVLDLTEKFMRHPTRILVKKEELTLRGLKQFYVAIEEAEKLEVLVDLYNEFSVAQSIIFVNQRHKADWLANQMTKRAFAVSCLHAELPKEERSAVMAAFKAGNTRVLIATNILARGIDVRQVNVAINYDLPLDTEQYLHRIGRVARYGRRGLAINFVTQRDVPTLQQLERHYDIQIDELPKNFADFLHC